MGRAWRLRRSLARLLRSLRSRSAFQEHASADAGHARLRQQDPRGTRRLFPDVRNFAIAAEEGAGKGENDRDVETMTLRIAKSLLVLAVALFYSFVVFNNTTDYDSNYQFVRHVLMMDSTFPANHGMWRAMNSPALHTAFYLSIIAWETATMLLAWWGGIRLARAAGGTAVEFDRSKSTAIAALTLALLMFTTIGIVLILLAQPDTDR